MRMLKAITGAAVAAIAASTFITVAPGVRAQEPSPAMIMARTVCFDEVVAFEAAFANIGAAGDATVEVNSLLQRLVPATSDRAAALRSGANLILASPVAIDRAHGILTLCMASVGVAADGGMRDLDAFKRHWASERARFKLPAPAESSAGGTRQPAPAPVSAIEVTHLERAARTTCAAEIKKFEAAHIESGGSQPEAAAAIEGILRSFIHDADSRARVARSFDEMARTARDPRDVARLSLNACASTVGTLWSIGTRAPGDFQSYWNGRGSARFAIGGETKANANGCVWIAWDEVRAGTAGTLMNTCPFTVDLRFCMVDPPPGSASESVACAKGLSRFERLEPNGSVRATLTEGARLNWTMCKAPQQPVQTSAPGASFAAACK